MNYETAVQAAKEKTDVVRLQDGIASDRIPGRIDRVELGRESYIARFVPTGSDGPPWQWVPIEEIFLADEPPEQVDHFAGKSIRDLVGLISRTAWSEGDGPEDMDRVKAAVAEIHHRLEAIQMYQGTEAVIIRMILLGRREAK